MGLLLKQLGKKPVRKIRSCLVSPSIFNNIRQSTQSTFRVLDNID